MRLYCIELDGRIYTVRACNATDASWKCIEIFVDQHSTAPHSTPLVLGYYTRTNKYVPLIDGLRKEG